MGQIISFQNLSIAPYEVEELIDIKIEQKINEHGTLYVKALLSSETKDNYARNCRQGSEVRIYITDSENDGTLFFGIIKDIEVSVSQGSYYMELNAVSYSYLLDIKKKKRSFQDKHKTYNLLINELVGEYEEAMIIDVASNGNKLNQLVVQYQETDWELLKRLASHFNTVIVNNIHYNKIKCYFGVSGNGSSVIEESNYSVKQDIEKFLKLSKNGINGISERDFVYYEVESEKPADVGDIIKFKGENLYVYKVKACIKKGVLLFYLTLTTKKGMLQRCKLHEKIVGVSLNARVDEINNDTVKVSLQIDNESAHSPGKQCFFPYSTIYSSKDGSGWYCMPEIGDSVRIYFPDGIEEHSYAISSVNDEIENNLQNGLGSNNGNVQNDKGGYSGKRDNPAIKSLRNQNGKEIRLTPGGIYIIADGTTITLTDEDGVSVVSNQNIEFKSEQNIIFSAEQDVNILGLAGVDLSCNEIASIKLEENVEVIGQEVKAN